MSVLYVTSFNRELYVASGQILLETYRKVRNTGDELLITHEGMPEHWQHADWTPQLSLDGHPWLTEVLNSNLDIIPEYLGGTLQPCGCPDPWERDHAKHTPGCRFNWWNRNWSRWFRKFVALQAAFRHAALNDHRYVVWADADCRFRRTVREQDVALEFKGACCWFHKGPVREAAETGLIGFDLKHPSALPMLQAICDAYGSGAFRKWHRMDDSWAFTWAAQLFPCRDCAHETNTHNRVMEHGPFRDLIRHLKGRHSRRLGLMK